MYFTTIFKKLLKSYTKKIDLYTLNGWTAWYMNYISIKLFCKKAVSAKESNK